MSYSYYEVYTNTQRAFAGIGFPYGADEDAAHIVTWLELYNLKGIDLFCAFIEKFDDQYDFKQHKDKYVKLVVVNKKDLYQFDMFVDKLLQADCHEVKIIEDFSDLDASNVSDDIVENTQDTMTLLELYIDDLTVDLSKDRLKNTMRVLYTEAQDLEI